MSEEEDALARFDLAPLERVVARVRKSLGFANSPLAVDPDVAEEFRQSSIQAFEYTYELTVKSVRRFLRIVVPVGDVDQLSFDGLIRLGNEQRLLKADLRAWTHFRTMRNQTSHTYDEEKAVAVFATIPAFLDEAVFALSAMQTRISQLGQR